MFCKEEYFCVKLGVVYLFCLFRYNVFATNRSVLYRWSLRCPSEGILSGSSWTDRTPFKPSDNSGFSVILWPSIDSLSTLILRYKLNFELAFIYFDSWTHGSVYISYQNRGWLFKTKWNKQTTHCLRNNHVYQINKIINYVH